MGVKEIASPAGRDFVRKVSMSEFYYRHAGLVRPTDLDQLRDSPGVSRVREISKDNFITRALIREQRRLRSNIR